jgi:hypothetical protein
MVCTVEFVAGGVARQIKHIVQVVTKSLTKLNIVTSEDYGGALMRGLNTRLLDAKRTVLNI